ncbi:hypothetical protein [Aeromonas sp. L_1B5_3]|uniref:hypothetical protein n=1 Tax=Aeromonas sp. L_1B5_3 TaxID=1588629 RepID=UPI000A8E3061|nr:hypothetical protein [Aeromonas sp. L_1B5_3]
MRDYFPVEHVKETLSAIKDGFLFEKLSQELLTHIMGYNFVPSGGIHDRGIDGLDYCSEAYQNSRSIYQMSIDKVPDQKIRRTILTLKKNNLDYQTLYYITNQSVVDKDLLIDKYFEEEKINLRIFDLSWLANNINKNQATQACMKSFTLRYSFSDARPQNAFHVTDYISRPDLYVFLTQQIGGTDEIERTNEKLIESLILYSLRDTDPDKKIFLSADEILNSVRTLIDFNMERIESKINKRLKSLCSKERRRINHHTTINKYCLPYNTRLEILSDNIRDEALYSAFMAEAESVVEKNLKNGNLSGITDVAGLLKTILEKIFYHQGLEFSDFLLNDGLKDSFELSLSSTVEEIVRDKNYKGIKDDRLVNAIIISIRDLMYNGSVESKGYLRALSKTYQMLFLLKCEPKVIDFFQSMAGHMHIFVCTSILVPALSEIFLEPQNKRYWSLLKAATARGVRLIVNDSIISELDFHIKRSIHIFRNEYEKQLQFYIDDAPELIDQILVRAYVHSLKEGRKISYYDFISNFITVGGSDTQQEIIDFLQNEFGIEFVTHSEIDAPIDHEDFEVLYEALKIAKKSEDKARTDASLILTIYAMRDKFGERKSSLEGYKTWWLSSDTVTHRTISKLFKEKYPVSCYMRPDFLYNYISFTPSKDSVNNIYRNTFPNLLGVQISHHIPSEISSNIRKAINEHEVQSGSRNGAKIRNLVDQLKTNHNINYRDELSSFFSQN